MTAATTQNLTDSELGRVLLTLRGLQWIIGTKGDPYALLLRAAGDDPHRLGRAVRDRGPVTWSSAEAWVTADHGLAAALLDEARLAPRRPADTSAEPAGEPMPWDVPALHEVLPLHDVFTGLDRAGWQDLIDRTVTPPPAPDIWRRALEGTGDRFDVLAGYARPAATAVVADAIGVPAGDRDRFAALTAATRGCLDASLCPPSLRDARALQAALGELRSMLGDDGSRLVAATAGVDAVVNLVAATVAALLDDPAQQASVRADPPLVPAAVEEAARTAPPIRLQRLFAQQPLTVAGHEIAAGEEVVVLIEAANRDPAVFTDPDRFDPHRPPRPGHLGFSGGLLGTAVAGLVRSQAGVAVGTLLAARQRLRPDGPRHRRLRSPVTGAFLRLDVAV